MSLRRGELSIPVNGGGLEIDILTLEGCGMAGYPGIFTGDLHSLNS